MINLNNVSLVCVATKDVLASLEALIYSSKKIKFFNILLITDQENLKKLGKIDSKIKVHIIKKFNSVKEWGKFIVFDLINYVESDYILLIHADGFVVNPYEWREEFLNYDFIGLSKNAARLVGSEKTLLKECGLSNKNIIERLNSLLIA